MIDKEAILNQVAATVNAYKVSQMAIELNKPYSTLSNELRHVEYAKLGFLTTLAILEKALEPGAKKIAQENARMVIEMICEAYGYVAYRIPAMGKGSMTHEMRLMGKLSKEFSENIGNMAVAIEDGKWEPEELEGCLRENQDLLRACLEVDAYLKKIEAGFQNASARG